MVIILYSYMIYILATNNHLTLYGPALPKRNTNSINYLGHVNLFQKRNIYSE